MSALIMFVSVAALAREGVAVLPLPYHFEYPLSYAHAGSFPLGFKWGLGTAAYQVEGAWNEGGREPSIWDVFTGGDGSAINPAMAAGPAAGHNGNVAIDQYHKFQEDVALLKALGIGVYRFSISWSRVLPKGTLAASGGRANQAGIDYYNALIDELVRNGIEPHVTLYHWDLPQALLNDTRTGHPSDYAGWLDARLPAIFAEYADVCFNAFGDRVKLWYTFNEAYTFVVMGYTGEHAPSLHNWESVKVREVARGTEPYLAAHNVLLAHAEAVALYRRDYQDSQQGLIGITNNVDWAEPGMDSEVHVEAAQRHVEFMLGWFADPIWLGDYPDSMRKLVGDRLPKFTAAQKRLLKGSSDVFGLNHYTSVFVYDMKQREPDVSHDACTMLDAAKVRTFPPSNSSWLRSVPWGFRKVLNWVQNRYQPSQIYVTENGWSVGAASAESGVCDPTRVGYLADYVSEMQRAISEDGVKVAGYIGWSLADNFEWKQGYTERFGLTYVDFDSPDRTRYLKTSMCWFAATVNANAVMPTEPYDALCEDGPPKRAVSVGEAMEMALGAKRASRHAHHSHGKHAMQHELLANGGIEEGEHGDDSSLLTAERLCAASFGKPLPDLPYAGSPTPIRTEATMPQALRAAGVGSGRSSSLFASGALGLAALAISMLVVLIVKSVVLPHGAEVHFKHAARDTDVKHAMRGWPFA